MNLSVPYLIPEELTVNTFLKQATSSSNLGSDCPMAVPIEMFSESHSKKNKNWEKRHLKKSPRQLFQRFRSLFLRTPSKILYNKINSPDNCEISPEKLVNPPFFLQCLRQQVILTKSCRRCSKIYQEWLLALSTCQPRYQIFSKYTAGLRNLKREISLK